MVVGTKTNNNQNKFNYDKPTRREYIKHGGTIISGGLLTGCIGTSQQLPQNSEDNNSNIDNQDSSYTVEIVPVGKVHFDSIPETWVANNGSWADMGIALGLEPPKAVWLTSRYHTHYYNEIPGVSVDKTDMISLYQDSVSKELFYELDGDIHVMDPNFLMNRFQGWKKEDIKEIKENIAPFFGNSIYAQHYPWHSDYRYYTLYQAFEKLSHVFRRQQYYVEFKKLHNKFQKKLAPIVPPRGKRPQVAVVWGVGDNPEKFYPYIIGNGTGFKHLNDLGVRDALANTNIKDFHGSRAAIDIETLLEVDPNILLLRGYEQKTEKQFQDKVVEFLKNHPTANKLTSVESDDVYRAGGLYQGPITNLVLTERTAKKLYNFNGELFDRQRVAEIINGDI